MTAPPCARGGAFFCCWNPCNSNLPRPATNTARCEIVACAFCMRCPHAISRRRHTSDARLAHLHFSKFRQFCELLSRSHRRTFVSAFAHQPIFGALLLFSCAFSSQQIRLLERRVSETDVRACGACRCPLSLRSRRRSPAASAAAGRGLRGGFCRSPRNFAIR